MSFIETRVELRAAISPSDLASPLDAIKLQLDEMLLKYSEDLQAVPVCYSGIEFDEGKDTGKIIAEQPWIHVEVLTTLVLFKPLKDQIIQGLITQVSDSHISLILYGTFNASIASAELSNKFTFNYSSQSWESSEGDLALGDYVSCKIINYNFANSILTINATDPERVER